MGFMDLKKSYDRVDFEAIWKMLRMFDVGGKLLKGINKCVNNLAHVRVKGDEIASFRIDCGVRQGCIPFPWLFIVYMDAVMEEMKMGIGRMGVRFLGEGRN